jgi:hypothetical protein
MKRLLIALKIIQEKKIKDPFGFTYKQSRLNPYNPLTYVVIICSLIIGLLMFGFVGFWNEVNWSELLKFKWR